MSYKFLKRLKHVFLIKLKRVGSKLRNTDAFRKERHVTVRPSDPLISLLSTFCLRCRNSFMRHDVTSLFSDVFPSHTYRVCGILVGCGGEVVGTPAAYSEIPGFKSLLRDR